VRDSTKKITLTACPRISLCHAFAVGS